MANKEKERAVRKKDQAFGGKTVESGKGQQEEKQRRQEAKNPTSQQKNAVSSTLSSSTIDEQDQFTPDNWLPHCPDLICLTGKHHPTNAEPPLTRFFYGGLTTPSELH